MKRKVIKQSGRAYTITLPVKWIRDRNVSEGDEIDVDTINGDLLISTKDKIREKKTIKLAISEGRESAIRTIIVNAYRSGFDILEIEFKGNKKILTKTVDTFMIGFELFERDNQYVIESVSEPSYENFENMINRMLYSIQEILEILPEEDMDNMVHKVQKYDNFLKRCISKEIFTIEGAAFLWQFLSSLTHIARAAYHFKKSLVQNKVKLNKKTKKLYERLHKMLEMLKRGYLKRDVSVLSQLHSLDQQMIDEGESINSPAAYHILTISRMIYLANSPLTGYLHFMNYAASK